MGKRQCQRIRDYFLFFCLVGAHAEQGCKERREKQVFFADFLSLFR